MIKKILTYLWFNLPLSALLVGAALWFTEPPALTPYTLYIPNSPTGGHVYYYGSGIALPATMTSGRPGVVDEVYCTTHKTLEQVGRPLGEWSFLTASVADFNQDESLDSRP